MLQAVRSEVQKRLPKEWSEEEIAQLTELWEQLKNDDGNSLKEKKREKKQLRTICATFYPTKNETRRIYFIWQYIHLEYRIFLIFLYTFVHFF